MWTTTSHSSPFAGRPARRAQRLAAGSALAVGWALALTACGDAGPGPGPEITPVPSTSAAASTASRSADPAEPKASFPAEPVAIGPATLVGGTVTCSIEFGPITTDDTGGEHVREGSAACTYAMDDQRVSGSTTETWMADAWTSDAGETALIQWGSSRLTTDEPHRRHPQLWIAARS